MSNDMIKIVDSLKGIAKDGGGTSGVSGNGFRVGEALTYGATKVRMKDTGNVIEGSKLYRSCTVKNLEAGYDVMVAVFDGGQGYFVIDRLL